MDFSLVYDCGESISRCGYTNKENAFYSHGLWAYTLTVNEYQQLLDLNWRRSGKYLYKPDPLKCISLQYTIRLDAHKFKCDKKHRSVIRKLRKYLENENIDSANHQNIQQKRQKRKNSASEKIEVRKTDIELQLENLLNQAIHHLYQKMLEDASTDTAMDITNDDENIPVAQVTITKGKNTKFGDLFCPTPSKLLPFFKKLLPQDQTSKMNQKSLGTSILTTMQLLFPEQISQIFQNVVVSDGNGFINFFLSNNFKSLLQQQQLEIQKLRLKENSQQTEKLQIKNTLQNSNNASSVISASSTSGNNNRNDSFEKHRLDIKLIPSEFSQESFELYKKYQIAVHKDEEKSITEKGYRSFLVDSPLKQSQSKVQKSHKLNVVDEIQGLEGLAKMTCSQFKGYGSFHIQYRIDGRLFMVAVVDILPLCLSSVYLYYDPDMSFLSLGIYSALSEILYVKTISKLLPNLKYYYMGYYIHTCQKMRYKGQYEPSDLLCPTNHVYVPMSKCMKQVEEDNKEDVAPGERKLKLIEEKDHCREKKMEHRIEDQLVCYNNCVQFYYNLDEKVRKRTRAKIEKFKRLIGPKTSKSIVYIIEEEEPEDDKEEQGDTL